MGISTAAPMSANQVGGQTQSAQQAPAPGNVTVEISFANAPAGMKSQVQTKGPVVATTRINYAMPGLAV
jgi:hypothetical protein